MHRAEYRLDQISRYSLDERDRRVSLDWSWCPPRWSTHRKGKQYRWAREIRWFLDHSHRICTHLNTSILNRIDQRVTKTYMTSEYVMVFDLCLVKVDAAVDRLGTTIVGWLIGKGVRLPWRIQQRLDRATTSVSSGNSLATVHRNDNRWCFPTDRWKTSSPPRHLSRRQQSHWTKIWVNAYRRWSRLVRWVTRDRRDCPRVVPSMLIRLSWCLHYCVGASSYCQKMDWAIASGCFRRDVDILSMHRFHFHHSQSLWSAPLEQQQEEILKGKDRTVRYQWVISIDDRRLGDDFCSSHLRNVLAWPVVAMTPMGNNDFHSWYSFLVRHKHEWSLFLQWTDRDGERWKYGDDQNRPRFTYRIYSLFRFSWARCERIIQVTICVNMTDVFDDLVEDDGDSE